VNKFLLTLLLLFLGNSVIHAQTENQVVYPKIGSICPDFVLRNIRYFSKRQAALKDFDGKWLVLDFWNKYCSSCVASFPKVSALQKEFADKVQFMMVGIEDPEKQIEPMFAKFRVKENLTMPCAFDSLLANLWDISACPHIIIMDNKGIVQGITASLDSDQMERLLTGRHPDLIHVYDPSDTLDHRMPFIADKPFLLNGNGGIDSDFLFRSVLSEFKLGSQVLFAPERIDASVKQGRFQVLGFPLYCLFNYAYFGVRFPGGFVGDSTRGEYHTKPVLEIKDSSLFEYSYTHDRNLFAYSLIMPPARASEENLKKAMQSDLHNYFGYESKVEYRKFRVWNLVATEDAKRKLQTKGGGLVYKETKTGFMARDWPFETLLNQLSFGFQDEIIYDETGIKGNIDINLTDDVWPKTWITIQEARKALQACGLDLVPSQKEMKVVVIRDSN
jgi:thiol-disulfide isomerase/thioredoxin